MNVGSEAVDRQIQSIAAEAPELTAEQFAYISGLMKRLTQPAATGAASPNNEPT